MTKPIPKPIQALLDQLAQRNGDVLALEKVIQQMQAQLNDYRRRNGELEERLAKTASGNSRLLDERDWFKRMFEKLLNAVGGEK